MPTVRGKRHRITSYTWGSKSFGRFPSEATWSNRISVIRRRVKSSNVMNQLKVLLLFVSALCLASAVGGIGSVHVLANNSGSSLTTTSLNGLGRLMASIMAILFAAMSYVTHVRSPIGWRFGWLVLVLSYASFVVGAISVTLENVPSLTFTDFWLPSGLVVIGGAAVTWYWGCKWYRQQSYFNSPPSK
jgi:hypothetical protein